MAFLPLFTWRDAQADIALVPLPISPRDYYMMIIAFTTIISFYVVMPRK